VRSYCPSSGASACSPTSPRACSGCSRSSEDLALPFTEPRPLALHGLARRTAPFMLLLYRYRDQREIRA